MTNNPMLDSLWVVIAATLVFLMQPGFMCLESGLTRSKNSINVAVKNLTDFIISVMTFWAFGFGMMFGLSDHGLLGTSHFFIDFNSDSSSATFFFFQAMFCGTATTIFSGAVAERMKFSSYLIIVVLLSTLVYPVFGHWAWNGLDTSTPSGWLGKAGFVDFAGSTVVHSVGGWLALATLLVIGPRTNRFLNGQNFFGFNGSNLPLSVLGTCLLWIGWIGFNGGSTLSMDENVPRIIVYTTLAGASGAISNLALGYLLTKIPRVTFVINGSLGGLVAITANCHCVNATGAVIIGLFAGVLCLVTELTLIWFKIDDAVGAVPVHLACGIWGTLAVALFGDPELIGTGLSMGSQLIAQLKGIVAAFGMAFLLPLFLIHWINRIFPLRVSIEDEHNGLNFSEHGATTELVELCQAMDRQAYTHDLSVRMPVEPFTEVGMIAARHNQIMDSLEEALSHTEAVVTLAKDAIITFVKESLEIININPSGMVMFGFQQNVPVSGVKLSDLFDGTNFQDISEPLWRGRTVETLGQRRCGTRFPMQAVITETGKGRDSFVIGTFRDITDQKEWEYSLKQSELRYRELFENIGIATVMVNSDTTLIMVNKEAEELFGYSRGEMELRMSFLQLVPDDERDRLEDYHAQRKTIPDQLPPSYECKIIDHQGRIIPAFINVSRIAGTDRSIATVMNLSELRAAQSSLNKQRAYFNQLFEGSSQAIVALDSEHRVMHLNNGFENMFGFRSADLRGKYLQDFLIPKDKLQEFFTLKTETENGTLVKEETKRLRSDGKAIPVSVLAFPVWNDNSLEGFFHIFEDITERKEFENKLYRQAFFDGLTEIPNRILFMNRVEIALERNKRKSDFNFAVLLLDLDRFKWVNDSLGHLAGDDLLRQVANRFSSCVRRGDTVARLGGDEFAILVEDFNTSSQVIEIANRLQQEAQRPFFIEKTEIHISASIGIVLNTEKYHSTEGIIRDADIAMYRAKELGKARFQIFNRKLHDLALQALQLENELREAISSEQLVLFYQPVIDIATQKLRGFEALVRWNHPEKGLVSPSDFIPIAEETGLIIPLGEWVLEEACRQLHIWHTADLGAEHIEMNVNISAKQFLQNNLISSIVDILESTGLSPEFLKVEITESAIMEGGQQTVERLNSLRKIGVKLAIDDFGTGYSSLASLQKFPISDLKIDRSFIYDLGNKEESKEIVKTIIALAKTLELGLVAEGVENEKQLVILQELQCDSVQGFYYSAPVPGEEVEKIIAEFL